MTIIADVQWFSGHSGAGVRSAMMYGVTRVHRRERDKYTTLCGRKIPWQSRRLLRPYANDPRCKACARKESAA